MISFLIASYDRVFAVDMKIGAHALVALGTRDTFLVLAVPDEIYTFLRCPFWREPFTSNSDFLEFFLES